MGLCSSKWSTPRLARYTYVTTFLYHFIFVNISVSFLVDYHSLGYQCLYHSTVLPIAHSTLEIL